MTSGRANYRILVVDDEEIVVSSIRDLVSGEQAIEVHGCSAAAEAIRLVRQSPYKYAVILMDYRLPSISGAEATKEILKINPNQIIAMNSGDGSREAAVESWRAGAVDFIQKGRDDAKKKILLCLRKYIESQEVFEEDGSPSEYRAKIEAVGLAGASPEGAKIAALIGKAGASDASVLLTGESGVGKDEVAQAIHRMSARAHMKFVADNMTAIPRELFESTLFGHVKGAFTGAIHDRIGHFKAAHGGTLFLDEIGDLELEHQAKLLRVLESKEFYPVGANKLERVNVRIISATNKNLEAEVAAKRFREDLYYRLNIIPIKVPPLRDRIEDIGPLIAHFKKKTKSNKVVLTEVIRKFERYPWPGNVRELFSELTRLNEFFPEDDRITLKHLDSRFFADLAPSEKQKAMMTFQELSDRHARELIDLIKAHRRRYSNWRDVASEGLKIPYSTLFSKLKSLGLVEDAQKNGKELSSNEGGNHDKET